MQSNPACHTSSPTSSVRACDSTYLRRAASRARRFAVSKVAGAILAVGLALPVSLALPPSAAAAVTGSSKFIPTLLVYYGGGPMLTAADAPNLAKFDLIDIDRFRYDQVGSNTWASIKALNPNAEIYLYE